MEVEGGGGGVFKGRGKTRNLNFRLPEKGGHVSYSCSRSVALFFYFLFMCSLRKRPLDNLLIGVWRVDGSGGQTRNASPVAINGSNVSHATAHDYVKVLTEGIR